MSINFNGGNINIYVERTVDRTYTITAYAIPWPLWSGVIIALLILIWTMSLKRRHPN